MPVNRHLIRCLLLGLGLLASGCAAKLPEIPVSQAAVEPGTMVTRAGRAQFALLGTPIAVGDPLPAVTLVDHNLAAVELASLTGQVLVISVVPSLDTRVCERQTHLLGEEGATLPLAIRRITISRDLPFAQNRFREETGFRDLLYLSDYQTSAFGLATGLLVDQLYLLARGVMVVDRDGRVRYQQFVPELTHLPDMEQAFAVARQVLAEP